LYSTIIIHPNNGDEFWSPSKKKIIFNHHAIVEMIFGQHSMVKIILVAIQQWGSFLVAIKW